VGKQKIETVEQFTEVVRNNEKIVVLKHSTTCPISQEAYDEFNSFVEGNEDVAAYFLYVQDARSLSNYIAEHYDIKHESPQVLVIENNQVKWNASHWKITNKSLAEAVNSK
jgi:bacillithiol system protein YtxJ